MIDATMAASLIVPVPALDIGISAAAVVCGRAFSLCRKELGG
jgi:hypothetical protein